MEELYKLIEDKIRNSGIPVFIKGEDFYNEVSDEADSKENGSYLFMIKKEDNFYYEGVMEIFDEQFDLHYVDFHLDGTVYHVDFDN